MLQIQGVHAGSKQVQPGPSQTDRSFTGGYLSTSQKDDMVTHVTSVSTSGGYVLSYCGRLRFLNVDTLTCSILCEEVGCIFLSPQTCADLSLS